MTWLEWLFVAWVALAVACWLLQLVLRRLRRNLDAQIAEMYAAE